MRIMIVDDHGGMREMLSGLLNVSSVKCCECPDGAQAVETFGEFRPDWVIMDAAMKGLNGFAATKNLLRAFPEAKVVLMSEDNSPRLSRAARACGASGFVTKDQLLELLGQPDTAKAFTPESLWADFDQHSSDGSET